MSHLEKVTIVKKSNVYFDGLCISHTVFLEDPLPTHTGHE